MKPVIHSGSIDGRTNLKAWVANDPADVNEMLVPGIGQSGRSSQCSDDFSLRVATAAGLARAPARDGIIASRALLVLERYAPDLLWRWLETTVAACEADDWMHCVEQLRRHFNWEFDGCNAR